MKKIKIYVFFLFILINLNVYANDTEFNEWKKNFKIITLSPQLYQQEPYLGNIVYLHANALCDKDDPVQ